MLNYSVPLYFDKRYVDGCIKINENTKNAQITSMYNCLPLIFDKSGFEQNRSAFLDGLNNFEDFVNVVQYAQSNGFEFIYLMNSPVGMHPFEFYLNNDRINSFLDKLLKNNIRILRITNTQVIDYISKNYPEFTIYASTSQEFYSIKQYRNLFSAYPQIKEVVPSYDLTRDFKFLKNYMKAFDKPIELMVNEGCLAGCPFRYHHNISNTHNEIFMSAIKREDESLFGYGDSQFISYYNKACYQLVEKGQWLQHILANIIYPWEIPYYVQETGINKFKIVGRNCNHDHKTMLQKNKVIITGQEDYEKIQNEPFCLLNNYISEDMRYSTLKIKDVKKYLPKAQEIAALQTASGINCLSDCGVNCHYCYKLAEVLNKQFK